jgi:hypothetical protein
LSLVIYEDIAICMMFGICVSSLYLPILQGCNAIGDRWTHCVSLHTPFPQVLFSNKAFFYPFMKIHKTTFMHVLHIMDQSWQNEYLNDGGSRFCNILIWGHDDMRHLPWNLNEKRIKSLRHEWFEVNECEYCTWWMKCNWLKPFRWWKNKFLQYSHIQTLPCTKGAPWWRYITQLYVSIAIHFYLRSLCEYFIIAIVQVYPCNKGIELSIVLTIHFKLSPMKVLFILLWSHATFFSCQWRHYSFGLMVNLNHLWWMGILYRMGHVKYLQYGIRWSRSTNWDWKKMIWKIKWVKSYNNESMDVYKKGGEMQNHSTIS